MKERAKSLTFRRCGLLDSFVIMWDFALRRPKSSLQLNDVLEHPLYLTGIASLDLNMCF